MASDDMIHALVLTKLIQPQYNESPSTPPCGLCDVKVGGYCYNHFCLPCQTGDLCYTQFQSRDSPHFNHERIQVFKTSYQCVVKEADLKLHFNTATRLVLKYNSNNSKCCYLKKKRCQEGSPGGTNSRRITCRGCENTFSLPRDSGNRDPGIVCSIECLLIHLRRAKGCLSRTLSFRNKARKQSAPVRSPME